MEGKKEEERMIMEKAVKRAKKILSGDEMRILLRL